MRPKFWIYPYGPSNSAIQLAKALSGRVIKRIGSKYKPCTKDVIINWGSGQLPYQGTKVLNKPNGVQVACSKLATFARLQAQGIAIPEYTQDQRVAQGWSEKHKVVGRDTDHGSAGRGITVYPRGSEIGRHLFYTKYFRKQREFRFHVYQGRVIRILEKLRKKDFDNHDPYIRSHLRGWVFGSSHLVGKPAPAELHALATRAVHVLGLDFGGVDIGWNIDSNGVVFEVNTAPGLEGTTIPAYAEAIKNGI